jgi:uncharacterized membrane protein YdjX (TVP38/TMEM64 family)
VEEAPMSREAWGRLAVLAVVLGVIAAWYALGLGNYLSFAALNAHKVELLTQVAEHPAASVALFMAVYVACVTFSLPVATALTILGGVLFGRWLGTVWVNLAATTGSALACLGARYLLREWAQARFAGDRLAALNRGMSENGLSYLLFLRLLPVFPFFLINLGAGLTVLPLRTFILGTMVGILPGTFLYVNAGAALTTIEKPSDVLSPAVLGALALLGLFALVPVVYKRWKQRRARPSAGK